MLPILVAEGGFLLPVAAIFSAFDLSKDTALGVVQIAPVLDVGVRRKRERRKAPKALQFHFREGPRGNLCLEFLPRHSAGTVTPFGPVTRPIPIPTRGSS